jgi:hypothetical protein
MRVLALPIVLLLDACSSPASATVDAVEFRNALGQITTGCGRLRGFADLLQKAQQGCIAAYKSIGWVPVTGEAATAA